jgi:hypothetical protein
MNTLPALHRPVGRRDGGARPGRPLRARSAVPAGPPHGRRRMVAARRLPADRRAGLHGHPGARSLRRRGAGRVHQRPGAAGLRALEPRAGAELGGAREPVPEQHLPQRQRGPAPALPARPVQGHADRRAGPDRARRRQRRDGLDAHHRHPGRGRRGRTLPAQRQQDLHHQRPGGRRAAGLRQDRPREGRQGHLGLHRREGLPGLQGGAEAGEDGLPRQPDRRAGVRQLPRAGAQPGR